MTRKEATQYLRTIKIYSTQDGYTDEAKEALDMAIKALEQQPCEDAISRQAVLDIAKTSKSNWIDNSVLFKKVNNLPPVTPQPKIGHWKRVELGMFDSVSIRWECSECKKSDRFRSNFCFNCGAKMESEDKE